MTSAAHPASLAVVGAGEFGNFMAEKLADYFELRLVRRASPDEDWRWAAQADYLILAVPFQSYDEVLDRLGPLGAKTVIFDVCSVKVLPIAALRERFPEQPLLATHPLFGPQSAGATFAGHNIVICPLPGGEAIEDRAKSFFEGLGLKVTLQLPEEHDRMMAELHGLTFFVARSLNLYGVQQQNLMTPSYQSLLKLAQLEEHHSAELFATIQLANPYAEEVRQRFCTIADELNHHLSTEIKS